MTKKTKILFILPSLKAGGAERVFSFVSQQLDRDTYRARLLVIGSKKDAAYTVEGIPVTFLNKARVLHAVPALLFFLVRHPQHLVVSSIGHLNTVLALLSPLFFRTRFVIREASVISVMKNFRGTGKSWYGRLSALSYPWLDAIICQSQDMADDFQRLFRIRAHKLHTIGNPITNTEGPIQKSPARKPNTFITVGRLSREKGQERLLEILGRFREDFRYTLIGDGPEKEALLQKIGALGLQDKVTHIPFTREVNAYLEQHACFLQGSYVEGFPNAVLESCALGTPVIAFDVPGGTREILEDGVNGYLVQTEAEFLERLSRPANWDPVAVSASVHRKLSPNTILKKYEKLFDTLLEK